MTKSIDIVERHLATSDGFISAQSLHQRITKAKTKIGLTSVYRALQKMVESGVVDTFRNPEGESEYRLCTPSHHHHIVCTSCGFTVEIDGEEIESWATTAAKRNGFSSIKHIADIYGLCQRCA